VIAVVSNIDPEHLDHYGDFDHLLAAFRQFVSSVPFYGRVVLHHEHPNVALLRDDLHKAVTTYGRSPQADFHIIEDVPQAGGQSITFGHIGSKQQVSFRLSMPGPHNAENALAAVAVLYELGMDMPTICRGMESFSGIQRRFQSVQIGGGTLVDDYGHHPAEVMATLTTARLSWPDADVLVLFQPHRYTRSRDLMNEFLGAFDDAAEVVLLPIYAAGEKAIEAVSSEVMVAGMQQRGHRNVRCCADLNEARDIAISGLAEGRIVLLMGAGSIGGLAASLRRDLREKPQ